jgi:hypothetical protein
MTFPMARTATSLLLAPLLVLHFFGCSGSEPGPGASSDPLRTESAFCAEWAKVACNDQVVEDCGGTAAGCRESQKIVCEDRLPFGYSSKYARECLDYVRDAYEDSVLTPEELNVMEDLTGECGRLIAGFSEEGDACTEDTDCDTVAGYFCVYEPGDVESTCQKPEIAEPDDDCSFAEVVCPEDRYCAALAEPDEGGICRPRKQLDAACSSDAECAQALHCEIPAGEALGTCEPRVAATEPCTTDEECETGLCVGAEPKCLTQVRLTGESVLCQELQ